MGLKFSELKKGTVKFSKEFKTMTGNVWLGLENEYDMGSEDPIEVFKRAEHTIQEYAKASGLVVYFDSNSNVLNPDFHPLPVITSYNEEPQIGVTPEVIMSCQELAVIDSYRLLIKGKPDLESAYETRRKQIVAGEISDIMKRTEDLRKPKTP